MLEHVCTEVRLCALVAREGPRIVFSEDAAPVYSAWWLSCSFVLVEACLVVNINPQLSKNSSPRTKSNCSRILPKSAESFVSVP